MIKGIYQSEDHCKRVSPPPGFIYKEKNRKNLKWNKSMMAIDKKFRLTLQLQIFRRTRLACERPMKVSLFVDRESLDINSSSVLWSDNNYPLWTRRKTQHTKFDLQTKHIFSVLTTKQVSLRLITRNILTLRNTNSELIWCPYKCTVKTNALKKRVEVLIGKIIFFIISWFSKLVIHVLIPVTISI